LVFPSGTRAAAVYRVATPAEVGGVRRQADDDALDNIVWAGSVAATGSVSESPKIERVARVYTRVQTCIMNARAKLFHNGGSQAVRLPKACRFPDDQGEVVVRREGRKVILEPVDEWPAAFVACLGAWSEALERSTSARLRNLKDPFR